MKRLGKNLIYFVCIISFQTSIFGMDYTGTVAGRDVGKKFPLTAETIKTYMYHPTHDEIQFLHAVEKNAFDTVKKYTESINLKRGYLFMIAVQIATQINSPQMVALIKQLRENQPIARIIK